MQRVQFVVHLTDKKTTYQGTEPNSQEESWVGDGILKYTSTAVHSKTYSLSATPHGQSNLLSHQDDVLSRSQWELRAALTTVAWTEGGRLHPRIRLSSNSLAPQALRALRSRVNSFPGCLSPVFYSPLDEEQIDLRTPQAVNYWS